MFTISLYFLFESKLLLFIPFILVIFGTVKHPDKADNLESHIAHSSLLTASPQLTHSPLPELSPL